MGGQGKMINRKRKFVGRKADDPEFDLDKKQFKVLHLNANEKRLIIVLEGAQLETVKVGPRTNIKRENPNVSVIPKGTQHLRAAELRRSCGYYAQKPKGSRIMSSGHHPPVPANALRFSPEPGWSSPGFRTHGAQCPDRNQSTDPNPQNFQTLCGIDGPIAAQVSDSCQ